MITGGSYSAAPEAAYIADGYEAVESEGRFVVQKQAASEIAKEEIDAFIETINVEGTTIEADPDTENTYNVTTQNNTISDTGLLQNIASQTGFAQMVVSDGVNPDVTYVASGDMDAFLAQVDALLPTKVDDPAVTLTITVSFTE